MKTQNSYAHPVTITKAVKITYDESPAHVGRLQFAVDFIVPENTPILASADGIVVDVKQDSDVGGSTKDFDSQGNYIEVEHTHGEYSIYEHIRKDGSLVKVGDQVKTGQVIGYSGNTGWMAHLGPHLHFAVHRYVGAGPEDYESLEIQWS